MKKQHIISALLLGTVVWVSSCKKDIYNGANSTLTSPFSDSTGVLKSAASFPVGIAIEYDLLKNNSTYRNTIFREANSVTFAYQMKHGAIVQSDGTLNFTKTDEMVKTVSDAGISIFGHVLAWHQNNNGAYLRTLSGGSTAAAPNLLANPGFELGSGASFTNWSAYNGASSFSAGTTAAEVHGGSRSLKVVNPTDNAGGQWRVQMASDLFNTTTGSDYKVSFWIKATAGGGSMRLSTAPTASYQGDQTIGTDWQQITWTFTARESATRILFDMGLKANTYYIDDVSVVDAALGTPPTGAEIATKVDAALKTFVQGMVTHYKDKVHAWDAVNECLRDDGTLRVGPYDSASEPSDTFYWGQYLGKDYIKNTFTYANQIDPTALLFINDYNLESSTAKLNALVNLINELKTAGVPIHGVGTQMHCNINTKYADIDNMFKKLASTGLKVRISELDVRLNPAEKVGDVAASPTLQTLQANMYNYVVKSYLQNVPAAQQHGITVWGVTDADSWIVVNQKKNDAPLLFKKDYGKKPAYAGMLQALKGQ
ncbi:hypothetical protein DU508_07055 [Pedobacter chinensis]|uniref:Beta-xylanase n=1 Tax=Pedobacter chinensis TaxID=2282421 RepID=A0A369PW94_9SPHI|nr:endo-1,4-beta-xylanase [Pedobacter chinensis]RDC56951.1 hypothetical protein DU508_07055 [Pedobacter chinensis]